MRLVVVVERSAMAVLTNISHLNAVDRVRVVISGKVNDVARITDRAHFRHHVRNVAERRLAVHCANMLSKHMTR